MKAGELEKRGEKRAEALAAIEQAKEEGDMDEVDKQSRRIVKVTIILKKFDFILNQNEIRTGVTLNDADEDLKDFKAKVRNK